ncbi:MAG: fibronectin type III domain-containing protein [Candidatus Parcubacteria bacterium]|nr:fibronectin type III domain-containing protein [Candidatus Parcubacteria bacterium]
MLLVSNFYFLPTAKAEVSIIISNIQVTQITPTSATVSWQTNINTDSRVIYGESETSLFRSFQNEEQLAVTTHQVVLTALLPATKYYFKVRSIPEITQGVAIAESLVNNFTTLNPIIVNFSNVQVTGKSTDSFILEYDTSTPDYNGIRYAATSEGLDKANNNMIGSVIAESGIPVLSIKPTHHKFYISGGPVAGGLGTWFTGNIVYYQIFSQLGVTPEIKSQIYEYIIPAASTKLNISNFTSELGVDSIKITWQTDRLATSKIYIKLSSELNYPNQYAWAWSKSENLKFSDDTLTQNHQYTITGLTKGTKYSLNIENFDSNKYYAQSLSSFTTLLQEATPLYKPNLASNPNPKDESQLTQTDLNSDGTITLSWTGSDPDTNTSDLRYDVYWGYPLNMPKICSGLIHPTCKSSKITIFDNYYSWTVFTYDPQNNASTSDEYWHVMVKSAAATTPTATTPSTATSSTATQFVQQEKALVTNIDTTLTNRLNGYILLQVQNAGQAWYVDPISDFKYYLPDGSSAYSALRKFGLGITNADLAKIPVGIESRFQDTDTDGDKLPDKLEEGLGTNPNSQDSDGDGYLDVTEIQNGYDPLGSGKLNIDTILANRLKGRILLQVQSKGEAWYVNPKDGKRYYMKDGPAAYEIMRYLSLGITNSDLRTIPVGSL